MEPYGQLLFIDSSSTNVFSGLVIFFKETVQVGVLEK